MTMISVEHIALRENGSPYVAGTGVKVANIATYALLHHWSIDKIAEELEITPAQIHAALAYYYDHKEEIDQAIKAGDELARQIGTSFQDLRQRIESQTPPKDHSV